MTLNSLGMTYRVFHLASVPKKLRTLYGTKGQVKGQMSCGGRWQSLAYSDDASARRYRPTEWVFLSKRRVAIAASASPPMPDPTHLTPTHLIKMSESIDE